MNSDLEARRDLEFFGVACLHEIGEPVLLQCAPLLASGEAREQDWNIAAQMLIEPCLVVVIAMQVRHVEEVGLLDPLMQIGAQLVVAWKRKPPTEECRLEPWVAEN